MIVLLLLIILSITPTEAANGILFPRIPDSDNYTSLYFSSMKRFYWVKDHRVDNYVINNDIKIDTVFYNDTKGWICKCCIKTQHGMNHIPGKKTFDKIYSPYQPIAYFFKEKENTTFKLFKKDKLMIGIPDPDEGPFVPEVLYLDKSLYETFDDVVMVTGKKRHCTDGISILIPHKNVATEEEATELIKYLNLNL